uniref:Calponin-homology (CH) domain-containing protein n=1 Tax=Syphacia muris TaxID=451379 RepID=A0A0N5AIU1_9BILA
MFKRNKELLNGSYITKDPEFLVPYFRKLNCDVFADEGVTDRCLQVAAILSCRSPDTETQVNIGDKLLEPLYHYS